MSLGFVPDVNDVNSLLVTSGSQTYIPNIDYVLDYANLKINFIQNGKQTLDVIEYFEVFIVFAYDGFDIIVVKL